MFNNGSNGTQGMSATVGQECIPSTHPFSSPSKSSPTRQLELGAVLSNEGIRRALQDGRLEIDPLPNAGETGEDAFGPTSVTLTLGCKFIRLPRYRWFKWRGYKILPMGRRRVDLTGKDFREFLRQEGEQVTLQPGQKIVLKPGDFMLAETRERVHFAMKPRVEFGGPLLCGWLTGLTRWARCGIGIELACRMHCGDDHRPALELYNLGPLEFVLTAGRQPIANLTVVHVEGVPSPHDSKVRGQIGPCGTQNQ